MRRILSGVAVATMALTGLATTASAHDVPNKCGETNSLNPTDGTPVYQRQGPIGGTRQIEIPGPDGKADFYIDDRDWIGWGGAMSLPMRAADQARNGEVGWDAWEHDHSGGIWIYQETDVRGGLQRGGDQIFFDQLPPDVKSAFYENVGSSDDSCKNPNADARDNVVF